MKKPVANVLILIGAFLLCAVFAIVLFFTGSNAYSAAPVRKKQVSGVSVNAVSIFDVSGVMKMTAANYLADEFVTPNKVVSDENDGKTPTKRGTYQFYIDTLEKDEWAESGKLDKLLKHDGNWHLTMYIPPVFGACSVFVRLKSEDYVGEIDKYNLDYYINNSSPSEFDESASHKTATKPMFLDITIPADGKYSEGCKVTVHYEADNDNFIGFWGNILIGEDSAVRGAVAVNRAVILSGAIIGVATVLLFLLICILKRSFSFIPQLLFATGIFCALFSTYMLFGATTVPYLFMALRRFSAGFLLFAAALYLPKKFKKAPVFYPTSAVAAAATVLAFVTPFCPTVAAYTALCYVYIALAFACVITIFAFTVLDVYKGKPLGLRLNTVITGVSAVMALFADKPVPFTLLSSAFWLYLVELGITLVLGLREFITAEIHNRYLTTNLEQEVARQTQNLQNILTERDNILLYVSHDMKRTVVGMNDSLTDLRQNLSEPELVAKVDNILQKNSELKKNFADLGKYGKQNYVAEQSEIVNLSEIVQKVTDDLRPDCEANGIILTVSLPEKMRVYAKKMALESVIQNLVLNAIEHSYCSHLSVSATKRKGFCHLDVVDDGQGITTEKDVFAAFVSGDANENENNSGLGLYLAKNAIEAMHGELTYTRKDRKTIFSSTLPLA